MSLTEDQTKYLQGLIEKKRGMLKQRQEENIQDYLTFEAFQGALRELDVLEARLLRQ